jgi:hypothetical protein
MLTTPPNLPSSRNPSDDTKSNLHTILGPIGMCGGACGCKHFRVIYTRRAAARRLVRRRECRHCGKRITTVEQEK